MDAKQITCSCCKTPVKYVEWWDDYRTNERVLRVHCHGDTQDMRINMMQIDRGVLVAMDGAQGVAFDVSDSSLPNDFQTLAHQIKTP